MGKSIDKIIEGLEKSKIIRHIDKPTDAVRNRHRDFFQGICLGVFFSILSIFLPLPIQSVQSGSSLDIEITIYYGLALIASLVVALILRFKN